jgi:hypothetical protein
MSFIAWMLVSIQVVAQPLPEQFHFQFNHGIENQPFFKLTGPNAMRAVQTDARGLRITLPAQRSQPGPVGVEPRFQLHGDFEITLSYELLAAEAPPPPMGAGVVLRLRFDDSPSRTVTLTRVRRRDQNESSMDQFATNLVTPGPDGKNNISTKLFPAHNMQGQLRLIRSGETLHFLVSDGPNSAFQEVRAIPIGTDDVKTLQAQCATGGREGSVDARLLALDIRSGQLPNQPAKPRAEASGNAKWLWLAVLACFLLGAAGSFFWWVRRRRSI